MIRPRSGYRILIVALVLASIAFRLVPARNLATAEGVRTPVTTSISVATDIAVRTGGQR